MPMPHTTHPSPHPAGAAGAAWQAQQQAVAVPSVAQAAESAEQQALVQAAVKFEAFFVAQMMKQMRQANAALADADSPLRQEVNQAPLAMADFAVADALAAQRAFGIADVLVRQMTRTLSRNL